MKQKIKKKDLLTCYLDTLGASLLENLFVGKARADED